MAIDLSHHEELTRKAVSHYWRTLTKQGTKQRTGVDTGRRAAVTGGMQMMGFCVLITKTLTANSIPETHVYADERLELPGFYRPTKEWDMIVVSDDTLIAALEFKSQRGPSFGNNFNNRSEEAIGTASDIWVAYREGAFGKRPRPWLGTLMLLEDCDASTRPVKVSEPHFKVFPEFRDASYAKRYELLLRKLVQERLYDSAALLTASEKTGRRGDYGEPSPADLGMRQFLAGLVGHAIARQAGAEGQ